MSGADDLSGVWYGRYVSIDGDQDNGFIALVEDGGGTLTGAISERAGGEAIRRAFIDGHRSGGTVAFTKRYDGSGGWAHSVEYAGTVNEHGTSIGGNWQVDWEHGDFVMTREIFDASELAEDREAEVPMTAPR